MIRFDSRHKGHTLKLELGNYTVSILSHKYSYNTIGETVEVAVLEGKNGAFCTRDFLPDLHDDVAGHITACELADLISKVSQANNNS